MNIDWYRNENWNETIKIDFMSRLSRARSQRDQYLVIQASTISDSFPDAALELINIYFASRKSEFDTVRALNVKAKSYLALNKFEESIKEMKVILEIERHKPNIKTNIFVEYPYFVATHNISSDYENAFSILSERESDLAFPIQIFMWHAAKSIIHSFYNQIIEARYHAGIALESAKIKKSGFSFHQNLGLVSEEHKKCVDILQKI